MHHLCSRVKRRKGSDTIIALTIAYSIAWTLFSLNWTSSGKQNYSAQLKALGCNETISLNRIVAEIQAASTNGHTFTEFTQVVGNFRPSSLNTESTISVMEIDRYNEFKYQKFKLTEPRFPRALDRTLFYKLATGTELLGEVPYIKSRGVVEVIKNGTFSPSSECGWPSNYTLMHKSSLKSSKHYDQLCPLMTPEGNSFQHFIDGLLPKLIQARQLLIHPEMKVLIPAPRSTDRGVILSMLKHIGLNLTQVVWGVKKIYSANFMVASCITPPLHPFLWNSARSLFGINDSVLVPANEAIVILLTRALSRNGGRSLLNQGEVVNFLRCRYGEKRVVIFKGGYSFTETLNLFGKAFLIIGVHGGALYNLNFAPRNAKILEIMPYRENRYPRGLAVTIFWSMASLIGQDYWRVYVESMSSKNNVIVDVGLLEETLSKMKL